MGEQLEQLETGVLNLCIILSTEYSSLGLNNPLGMTFDEIVNIDPYTAMHKIELVIEDLLSAKEEFQKSSLYKQHLENNSYQKALQKLEETVRNHLKIQQQLKMHIDTLQEQANEALTERETFTGRDQQKIQQLKKNNKILRKQVKTQMTEMKSSLSPISREKATATPIQNPIANGSQKLIQLMKKNKQLLTQKHLVNFKLEQSKLECKKYVENNREICNTLVSQKPTAEEEKALVELYKNKYEQQSTELLRLSYKFKQFEVYHHVGKRKENSLYRSSQPRRRGSNERSKKTVKTPINRTVML